MVYTQMFILSHMFGILKLKERVPFLDAEAGLPYGFSS